MYLRFSSPLSGFAHRQRSPKALLPDPSRRGRGCLQARDRPAGQGIRPFGRAGFPKRQPPAHWQKGPLPQPHSKNRQKREKSTENNRNLKQKEDAIKQGNKIVGTTEVTGAGVIVTLSDSKRDASTTLNVNDLLVHDVDVLSVINELKNAGAEAICINNQRLVPTSSIVCGGNIIEINGEKVGAPFEIKAIGLPEQLAALSRPGGYLEI